MDAQALSRLDDWEVVKAVLPAGWREQAKALGALKRRRGVPDAEALLRLLLIHLAGGCSLRETAVRAQGAELCQVSNVAVLKRLRSAGEWLGWMVEQLAASAGAALSPEAQRLAGRLCVVDSTALRAPGATSTTWRVHYALGFPGLRCEQVHVTGAKVGESLRMFSFAPGQIGLADRGYGHPANIAHAVGQGAHLVARISRTALPMYQEQGQRFDLLAHLRTLPATTALDWPVWITHDDQRIAGRLCAVRKSKAAAKRERRRILRKAQTKRQRVRPESLQAAGYTFVFTSLPAQVSATTVLELYRGRWQVELAFKRLKSLLGLGHLKTTDPVAARTWIQGKLLVALLIEALLAAAQRFSPWGYPLAGPLGTDPQPVAGNPAHA